MARLGKAVFGPSFFSSPTAITLQQQVEEPRRKNQILARIIQELKAKQVGSTKPVQGADVEDGRKHLDRRHCKQVLRFQQRSAEPLKRMMRLLYSQGLYLLLEPPSQFIETTVGGHLFPLSVGVVNVKKLGSDFTSCHG
ncbi:hypothetical protein MRX96_042597 [Rhipicephalus microplus]